MTKLGNPFEARNRAGTVVTNKSSTTRSFISATYGLTIRKVTRVIELGYYRGFQSRKKHQPSVQLHILAQRQNEIFTYFNPGSGPDLSI